MAQDYTATLNLPSTEFPMRANLPAREPEMLKQAYDLDLYHEMVKRNEGKPDFMLHDGPPFSNGNIHMGTALNKVLKDFIVKYKSMTGYRAVYIPGWDNHGMPIESAIIRQNKLDRKKMSISDFRRECQKFAMKFVGIQRESFKRLGVLGEWDKPYLTMDPDFEAREVRVFGEMFKKGYIYKGLKPVYWCPHDETALAEAEIEYKDEPCTSIFVKFAVKDDRGVFGGDVDNTYFIIWTTTTWTLPGNVAIAVHPREKYALVAAANGEKYVVAEALADKTMAEGGVTDYEIKATYTGAELEFIKCAHPFLDRESVLLLADYVTMESGTGCVHTAPGFGADDYMTCMRYKMDVVVPVDDRGYQTADAGKFAGMYYEESNKAILDDLRDSGALFASQEIIHSYPHCWRCKNPIIFRATPQWFCSVDSFKDQAVAACDDVQWMPEWGHDRMISMIRERADWCISRQRHWGLPIPVFYCEDCKKPVCTDETINKISEIFAAESSNAWFDKPVEELLPDGMKCPHCGGTHFTKESDTLDGWFDSGSTHFRVLDDSDELPWPADLYLEGADQYRGWFQSSLLTAVGAKEQGAPYKAVLTHGWVVDGEGRAMHKSLGNGIAPEEIISKFGGDLLRLWASSADFRVDVRASDNIFKQLSETYRKIRNTARLFMANLGDFDPETDAVAPEDLCELDKWALARLDRAVANVRRAYDDYEFHIVYHEINNFCTIDMSKLYIDITKDRLYVEKKDSAARRGAQTVMYTVLDALTRMVAPILSFTADEIWRSMPHTKSEDPRSALLNDMPEAGKYAFGDVEERWNALFDLRDEVLKALEDARAAKLIGKSLEAKVIITADDAKYAVLDAFRDELPTVFITSQVELVRGGDGMSVEVAHADGEKCDRCWMYSTDVAPHGEGHLCKRCAEILS